MNKDISIYLEEHLEDFISEEISSGRYNSVSDVISSALRLLEQEERKEKELIKELEVGEKTELLDNFAPSEHLKMLHRTTSE
ncbi:type II toxin-antitoxin system ParD family antitoxin [Salinimicrobium sp. GXAS 041]|uniref:type II toxin-antitoxin system ParD family antitoxin n=1 Tax=Salinimicrobium sp. GXAS 041 TaxID=3400806 RepID=UPI003C725C4F